jgi:type III pantothenate kinase
MMYESPQTLGMDRWLLANAVFLEHQSDLLVVTLGTCITYNVVKNGSFLGGAISPGLDLRFKAMNAFTAALPLVNSNPSATLLGTTTESSMQAGVNKAMAFEIQAMIDAYVNEFDLEKVIVCGGAINTLGNHLKNSIFAPSNYELYALQRIYEYFQNQ